MHYQHRYHAGNFADVFKHVLLLALLRALNLKEAPWCFYDTHAGEGEYWLDQPQAQATAEADEGISRLLGMSGPLPGALSDYLAQLAAINAQGPIQVYPGSPRWAQRLARDDDRLVLCERQPLIAQQLREVMAGDPRVHIHQRDGYEAAALLPPREKRALVLIDPPYERADEFDAATAFLGQALRRFGHGVYALWYPYKQRHRTEQWLRRLREQLPYEAVNVSFAVSAPAQGQMRACGMIVVNPPYAFLNEAQACLPILLERLGRGSGQFADLQSWPRRTS